MSEPTTHAIVVRGAVLTYDVREPATPSEHRPLFVFGTPMGTRPGSRKWCSTWATGQ